jgi:hypothetical protein
MTEFINSGQDDVPEDPLPEKPERDSRPFLTAQAKRMAEHYRETGRVFPADHPTYDYYPGLEVVMTQPTEVVAVPEKYVPGEEAKRAAIEEIEKLYWLAFTTSSSEPAVETLKPYFDYLESDDAEEVYHRIDQLRREYGFTDNADHRSKLTRS